MTESELNNIFKENKKEFSDDFFTLKLRHRLPDRRFIDPQIIIAIFAAVGFILVYWIIGTDTINDVLNSFVQSFENLQMFSVSCIILYLGLLTTTFFTGYAVFKAGEE